MWFRHVVENWILLRNVNISLSMLNSQYRKLILPIFDEHFYLSNLGDMELIPNELEKGIIWEYDTINNEWSRGVIRIKVAEKAFTEGAHSKVHHVEVIGKVIPCKIPADSKILGDKILKDFVSHQFKKKGSFIAKFSKRSIPSDRYFEEVKLQMVVKDFANKFNNHVMVKELTKKVEFLMMWVLEITRDNQTVLCRFEPYDRSFKRNVSSQGGFLRDNAIPQAFTHFSYEMSNHNILIVDLEHINYQIIGDLYVDARIHTPDGKGFGEYNLGIAGINRFLKTHTCSFVCKLLELPVINEPKRRFPQLPPPNIELPSPLLPTPDTLNIGNNKEFKCIKTLWVEDSVNSMIVALNVGYLFSATADGVITVFNLREDKRIIDEGKKEKGKGKEKNNNKKVWNIHDWSLVTLFRAHSKSVEGMCVTDTHLFTSSSDHTIRVWKLGDFSLVHTMRGHSGDVYYVIVEGDYLYSSSFDKTIKVWSVSTFKLHTTLQGHTRAVRTLLIVGNYLFSGSNDGTILVWKLTNMQDIVCVFCIEADDSWITTLAYHNYHLFSGSIDGTVKARDLRNFKNTSTFTECQDYVNSIVVTNKYLISASDDRNVVILEHGKDKKERVVAILKGHKARVQYVIVHDGQIITGSDDCTIKVWK